MVKTKQSAQSVRGRCRQESGTEYKQKSQPSPRPPLRTPTSRGGKSADSFCSTKATWAATRPHSTISVTLRASTRKISASDAIRARARSWTATNRSGSPHAATTPMFPRELTPSTAAQTQMTDTFDLLPNSEMILCGDSLHVHSTEWSTTRRAIRSAMSS